MWYGSEKFDACALLHALLLFSNMLFNTLTNQILKPKAFHNNKSKTNWLKIL